MRYICVSLDGRERLKGLNTKVLLYLARVRYFGKCLHIRSDQKSVLRDLPHCIIDV